MGALKLPDWLHSARNADSVALFYRQLSVLLNAGVQLNDALVCLTRNDDEQFARMVGDIQLQISTGSKLSVALQTYSRVFSPVAIGMVAAAEMSGALAATLDRLAELSERATRLRKTVISSMTYPIVQFVCIFAVLLFFVLAISPNDDGIFALVGGELPWPTRVLVALSGYLRSPTLIIATGLLVSGLVGWFLRLLQRSDQFRLNLHDFLLRVPVFGALLGKVEAVRVVDSMESMMTVGVPALKSIQLAEKVVGNLAIRKRLEFARKEIRDGSGIGKAFAHQEIFAPMVAAMIEIGEDSGRLDEMLRVVAIRLDEDVELALQTMVKLLEPLLMSFAGLAAAFVALAGMMPFMQLISNL